MFDENKNLYETVFNILPDTVLLIDKKGILIDVNRRMEEWLGYSPDEVVGTHLFKLPALTMTAKVIVAKKFTDRMRGKEVIPYEIHFRAKDGTVMTGLVRASAMHDEDGKISHDVVLITNTSKDKILSAQIADAQRKYKYLFANLPYGFANHKMIFDKDGKPVDYIFEEVNEKYEQMTDLKADEIIGKKLTDVLPDIQNDKFDWIGEYGKVVLTRQPKVIESFSESLDRWYQISAYSPEKGHFVTIINDITEDKKNEEELTKGTDEIKEKVDELSRMNKVMENREEKIKALKKEIEEIEAKK